MGLEAGLEEEGVCLATGLDEGGEKGGVRKPEGELAKDLDAGLAGTTGDSN